MVATEHIVTRAEPEMYSGLAHETSKSNYVISSSTAEDVLRKPHRVKSRNSYIFNSNHNNTNNCRIISMTMAAKTPKPQWSPHTRTRVFMSLQAGKSARVIALEEGIPQGSISGIAKRYTKQISAKSLPRPKRDKKIGEREQRHILRIIERNPSITQKDLVAQAGLDCSKRTLTRFLESKGIRRTGALGRPFLSTGGSLMRSKFNGDSSELLRGKPGRSFGRMAGMLVVGTHI